METKEYNLTLSLPLEKTKSKTIILNIKDFELNLFERKEIKSKYPITIHRVK